MRVIQKKVALQFLSGYTAIEQRFMMSKTHNKYRYLFIALAVLLAVSMVSCGDDNFYDLSGLSDFGNLIGCAVGSSNPLCPGYAAPITIPTDPGDPEPSLYEVNGAWYLSAAGGASGGYMFDSGEFYIFNDSFVFNPDYSLVDPSNVCTGWGRADSTGSFSGESMDGMITQDSDLVACVFNSGGYDIFSTIFNRNNTDDLQQPDMSGTWNTFLAIYESKQPDIFTTGSVTIDDTGNVVSGYTSPLYGDYVNSNGNPVVYSDGIMKLASKGYLHGKISFLGAPNVSFSYQGALIRRKSFVSLMGGYNFLLYNNYSYYYPFIGFMIKQGGTFSNSDLAGTWHTYFLTSENTYAYGTVELNSLGGLVSGEYISSKGDTSSYILGGLSMDAGGMISGSLRHIDDTININGGKMEMNKDIAVLSASSAQNDSLVIMIKEAVN